MIISASRRTDIPTYYGKWFLNRLKEGFTLVPNPYNAHHLSKVSLSPDAVDCIVFWTKNPEPMLGLLPQISDLGYKYYFQYTLTPYGKPWESNLPPVERRVNTFCTLSEMIGNERLVWRYDPIIITNSFTIDYHIEKFFLLCEKIAPYTDECVISFADQYAHNAKIIPPVSDGMMRSVAKALSEIAKGFDLKITSCAEKIGLKKYGIEHASCIDKKRIEKILGCSINSKKDANQRPECGCIESVDIGTYNTCQSHCKYCYATKSQTAAQNNFKLHDPSSPMLIGFPKDDAIITERKISSLKNIQTSLL